MPLAMLLDIYFPPAKYLEIYPGKVPVKSVPATVPAPVTDEFAGLKRFDIQVPLALVAERKSMQLTDADGTICDYRSVALKGYLSTFVGTTAMDREGDYVEQGAFSDTIKEFANNPIMLRDHRNVTGDVVGSFTVMREDSKGLYVEAVMSDAPDVQSLRFKVAEGHLKTLSMGGLFHYKADGRGIFKVDLWEGSITPIPSNPDARFQVRALTDLEKKFLKSASTFKNFSQFLQASLQQNHAGLAAK
jgi:HK97 family phage prohead protease